MKKNSFFLITFFILINNSIAQKAPLGMVKVGENLFVDDTEITNNEYRQFLDDLKTQGKTDLYQKYYPDTTVWRISESNEVFVKLYFPHPAFDNYPVVGVSYEAAVYFCEWRTDYYNKNLKNNIALIKFRLPSKAEWESMAKSNQEKAELAGGWQQSTDSKSGNKKFNYYLFNYKTSDTEYFKDGFLYTSPVKSYAASSNKVFDLAGNVEEMVQEQGIAKGGSWYQDESFIKISKDDTYIKPTAWIGFRCVAQFEKVP